MAAPSYLLTSWASAGNQAAAVIGLVEARLTVAGWVFVEERTFTQASTARAMRVWRNPAALNFSGTEFFVGLVSDVAGGGYFAIRAFEGWDTTAKVIRRPCIRGNVSAVPVASVWHGGAGDWAVDGSTVPLMVDSVPFGPSGVAAPLPAATSLDVAVLASASYLVLGVAAMGSTISLGAWMVGLFQPAYVESAATFPPLAVVELGQPAGASPNSGVSRSVRVTNGGSAFSAGVGPETIQIGGVDSGVAAPDKATGFIRGSRAAVAGMRGAPAPYSTAAYRGVLCDAVAVRGSALRLGDMFTVAGSTYTVMQAVGSDVVNSPLSPGTQVYAFDVTAGS